MQHKVAVSLALLLSTCGSVKDVAMTNQLLTITAKCRGVDPCVFEGKDLFLDIRITNNGKSTIGFPLAFVQKAGPIVRLVNRRTKAETYIPTNPADFDLLEELTQIPPGESAVVEWVITAGELRDFGGRPVDVDAEVTIKTKIQVEGKGADFLGTDTLRIVSKEKL
jgi:hypothetical protein